MERNFAPLRSVHSREATPAFIFMARSVHWLVAYSSLVVNWPSALVVAVTSETAVADTKLATEVD